MATSEKTNPLKMVVRFLASVYFWIELFGISAILTPVGVLIFIFTSPFDKRQLIQHKFTCLWAFIVLFVNPMWRIKITGREKIDPKQTYVMVSNHQSGADILVLFLLWVHFKWIAKKSLFSYPFIGWNMSLNRYISLERNSSTSMKKMLKSASDAIRAGNSVMIFPEGTRSKDGKLQSFKTGAFHLALENRVSIVPIAITGTSKAIRKGGFLINRNFDIRADVLDPVPYQEFESLSLKDTAVLLHGKISSKLDSII